MFFFLLLIKSRIVSTQVACFLFLLSQCLFPSHSLQCLGKTESLLKPRKLPPVKTSWQQRDEIADEWCQKPLYTTFGYCILEKAELCSCTCLSWALCRAGQPWCNAGCRVDTGSPADAFAFSTHITLDLLLSLHCSFVEPSDFLNELHKWMLADVCWKENGLVANLELCKSSFSSMISLQIPYENSVVLFSLCASFLSSKGHTSHLAWELRVNIEPVNVPEE